MSYPPYQGNPSQPPYGQPPTQPYPPNPQQQPLYGQPASQQRPAQQPSYPPQHGHGQQQYTPQGYPPQSYPPQSYPPQSYPPQSHPPQSYPPQSQPPQGFPPQGYPPQQGQYGAPLNPSYPSQSHPQQGYPQQGYPPQQQPYGTPLPQPTPASPGYTHVWIATDMSGQATQLREAMKGFGTRERPLITVLSQVPDAPHMIKLRQTYDEHFKRSLLKDLHSETSGNFREVLLALARGPLDQDVHAVHQAISGAGTNEHLLDDVLTGRSNADMKAIKDVYHREHHKDLSKAVSEDLSMETEKLFEYILSANRAEESVPINYAEIEDKVDRLYNATEGHQFGHIADAVCQIMAFSSDTQLRAINARYAEKYRHDLDQIIKHKFSGHMENALRLMLSRAVDRAKSDADGLEDAMKGIGTNDLLLIERMVRARMMGREHMSQVCLAYQKWYGKSLSQRIHGETGGHYRDTLMALCV